MPLLAPQPEQPNPIELLSWRQGATNAGQQYDQENARLTYMKNQATNTYGIQNRQAAFNNRMQRQQFDDPYIGRGLLHSGIRNAGLTNMYTGQGNDAAMREQQYGAQMGGYGLDAYSAMLNRDTTLGNIAAQEQARRTQLAQEIKGII